MAKACKLISATVADAVGKLAELTGAVKDGGMNIQAMCAWVEAGQGKLLMHTDDNEKACAAITPVVDNCDWADAVCLQAANTPGALNEIAAKLAAEGIAIDLCFATAGGASEATIVLMTSDNAKAAEIL